jgi:hypothetical protein
LCQHGAAACLLFSTSSSKSLVLLVLNARAAQKPLQV